VRYIYAFIASLILLSGHLSVETGLCAAADSADETAGKEDPAPEEIIEMFTQKETEFYSAWKQYTYTQTTAIRVISVDGYPPPRKEAMTIMSQVVFNDDGSREVRILRETGQLRSVGFTEEDMEVINNINPFALTKEDLPNYDVKYRGKERVDELICYVFSVKPKQMEEGRLYFEGKIWVDDIDLQVVRTLGKQPIDGQYWFPVWTHADEDLHFPDNRVRIEETILYEGYKRFTSGATIEYETDMEPE
jgi:hypothetical protein